MKLPNTSLIIESEKVLVDNTHKLVDAKYRVYIRKYHDNLSIHFHTLGST